MHIHCCCSRTERLSGPCPTAVRRARKRRPAADRASRGPCHILTNHNKFFWGSQMDLIENVQHRFTFIPKQHELSSTNQAGKMQTCRVGMKGYSHKLGDQLHALMDTIHRVIRYPDNPKSEANSGDCSDQPWGKSALQAE